MSESERARKHPHTGQMPAVRQEGESGSSVITIPKGVRDRLGLEDGEEPAEIEYSEEIREVTFQFSTDD